MKRLCKVFTVLAFLAVVATMVNAIIFRLANFRKASQKGFLYKWRHGDIRYIVEGSGAPLLLIHDLDIGASRAEWDAHVDNLAKHYRVYALDLVGFGHSEKPHTTYSSYLYVSLINAFIRDVIGAKVNIAATGRSADHAVMAYYLEPHLYQKMLLICPTGLCETHLFPNHKSFWLRNILNTPVIGTSIYNIMASRLALKYHLKKHSFHNKKAVTRSITNQFYYYAHLDGAASRHPIAHLLSNYLNVRIEHALPRLNLPVHILWGANPNSKKVKQINPKITHSVLASTKSYPHLEDPQVFHKQCLSFFA